MSLTKRILFGKDPADDHFRRRMAKESAAYLVQFSFRVPMRRKSKGGGRPHWDRRWPIGLELAVRDLKLEVVRVNGGMLFRTADQRDAVLRKAERYWADYMRKSEGN